MTFPIFCWPPKPDPDPNLDKELNSTINTTYNLDANSDIDKDYDANISIVSNTDVTGNSTTIIGDAEAVGTDTVVEIEFSAITLENELSSGFVSVLAATG